MRAPFTQIYIHLVWTTWDRASLIYEDIESRLYKAMAKRCVDLNCIPLAIGGTKDHVHLLVSLHPTVAVSDLVKDVKGASSHLMTHEIMPGGDFRWQGAYGAFSIRESEVEQVMHYIRNQKAHHVSGNISTSFEQSEIVR